MIRFWLVDKDGNVVFNTVDKQEAYEYQNRRRPDTVLKMVRIQLDKAVNTAKGLADAAFVTVQPSKA